MQLVNEIVHTEKEAVEEVEKKTSEITHNHRDKILALQKDHETKKQELVTNLESQISQEKEKQEKRFDKTQKSLKSQSLTKNEITSLARKIIANIK